MTDAWKGIDLGGEGLQQANLQLLRVLRRRRRAYLLLLAFPLGAHRVYLHEPLGAWAYRALSVAALALLAVAPRWSLVPACALAALLAFDLVWIDRRVTALNKRLRMQAYLRPGHGAPAGFRGRHFDEQASDAGAAPRRAASFAEQERLLAELERKRRAPRN